ncbi:MAG: efflux RND transporter periplasmic adaptor subunit [Pseudomonadota bacterium]
MSTSKKTRSLPSRIISGVVTMFGTGAVLALAALAIWQGSSLIADRADAVAKPQPTKPIAVSTSRIKMEEGYEVPRRFTGQIEALQTVSLAFEQGGTVKEVLVDDGAKVQKGQLLARLDARLLQADLSRLQASKKALEAQRELAQLTDQRQAQLQKRGFASAQRADQSRLSLLEIDARMAELEASIKAAQIRLEKTELLAPFDGTVNTRLVDAGNTVGASQGVLSVVERGALIFRVGIAPRLVNQLTVGEMVEIRFDDKPYNAEIIALLPQVDPVTRTRIVRAQLTSAPDLAFGTTGEIQLSEWAGAPGAWVPLTAIEDGVRGLWTIKTIAKDDETRVAIEAVEVIYADGERAYIRGTFAPDVAYIDKGVHRVVVGQQVQVMDR